MGRAHVRLVAALAVVTGGGWAALAAAAQAADGSLSVPARLYVGYPGLFTVKAGSGAGIDAVRLERRSGSGWARVAQEDARSGGTELVAKLPAGRQTLRAVGLGDAGETVLGERGLTVLRPGRRTTTRRDDGSYVARPAPQNSTLRFTVGGSGRSISSFRASVTTFCFGPSAESNSVSTNFAVLSRIAVAPDGAVVKEFKTDGSRQLLVGRLRGGRFTGEVSVRFSTCSGTRKLTAQRR